MKPERMPRLIGRARLWVDRSVQRRLVVWSAVFWVLSISILGLAFLWVGRSWMMNETSGRNIQLASVISRDTNARVAAMVSDARAFARYLSTFDDPSRQAEAAVSLRLASPQRYHSAYYFDYDGDLLFHLTESQGPLLPATDATRVPNGRLEVVSEEVRTAYLNASGTAYVSDVNFVGIDRSPVILVGIPVSIANSRANVIVLELDLSDIWRRLDLITVGQSGFAYLVSREGEVLFHPDPTRVGSKAPVEMTPLLSGYEGSTRYPDASRGAALAAFSPVGGPTGWGIIVQQDESEAFSPISRTGALMLMAWLAMAAFGTVGISFVVRGFTRPIVQLTRTARGIASTGALSTTGMERNPDEVGQLSHAFDQMIERLQLADRRLAGSEHKYRSLFENASDAILLIEGGIFIDCNHKAEELFGCGHNDIVGSGPERFSPPQQPDGMDSSASVKARVGVALAGVPQLFHWKHVRPDGTPFDAEVSLNRIEIEGQSLLQAIIRDVTERVQAYELLEQRVQERTRQLSTLLEVSRDVASTLEQGPLLGLILDHL